MALLPFLFATNIDENSLILGDVLLDNLEGVFGKLDIAARGVGLEC
jgi:hypothetical protein